MFSYSCQVISIYDADTITGVVDLGFKLNFKIKLRLFGINAPEMRGKEKRQGTKSRDWLREQILDKTVQINTIKDKQGKYGRYLTVIYYNGENINEKLVMLGYAKHKTY